ncbi:MAG: UDP-N-acetylmuramoyl-L-alanine--D-glutamate ligase [Legionellaceae bacterium]|nr:UDP-N-acetylmuramoyl-L-alanine--D-glutamate ligase [Legionellaceae bacterium]
MDGTIYLVIGLGKTGYSIARYLRRRNISFAVFDTRSAVVNIDDFKQECSPVEVFLGVVPQSFYKKISTIIVSPGVDENLEEVQKLINLGVPYYGDIECFAREVSAPVIAITGTNGKSTVTTLVGDMAKNFDVSVGVGGNIGTPVLDLLDDEQQYGLWVLELSSFQLDLISSLKPIAATVLNVSEDHIDRHGTLENYIKAKQQIYNNSKFLVYNRQDESSIPYNLSEYPNEYISSYGLDEPDGNNWGLREVDGKTYIAQGVENLIQIDLLKIKGKHSWINVVAACALADIAGISLVAMRSAAQEFRGLPHRTQWLRNIDGVDWIDDSKGTNVGATVAAISGLGEAADGKLVLIAGGSGKGADFSDLRAVVMKYVRAVILIGKDASIIESALDDSTKIIRAQSMEDAVLKAKEEALSEDMVLLSPACASFDMFNDFNHRGEVFTALVERL